MDLHKVTTGDPNNLTACVECSADYGQTGCKRSLVHQDEEVNARTSQEYLGISICYTLTRNGA